MRKQSTGPGRRYEGRLDSGRPPGSSYATTNVMRAEPIDKLRTTPVEALQECTLRQAQGASRDPQQ
jgi:hypothetical protein